MDKFTRESLYDMLDILKERPEKYERKIKLLEKRLKNEVQTNSDNEERDPGSEDGGGSEG